MYFKKNFTNTFGKKKGPEGFGPHMYVGHVHI